jgi:hypothetical protein
MMDPRLKAPDMPDHPFPKDCYDNVPENVYIPGNPYLPNLQPAPGAPGTPGYPCVPQETVIKDVLLARAYVPFQRLCSTYPAVRALCRGTLFPELFSPYRGPDKKLRPPQYE